MKVEEEANDSHLHDEFGQPLKNFMKEKLIYVGIYKEFNIVHSLSSSTLKILPSKEFKEEMKINSNIVNEKRCDVLLLWMKYNLYFL